MAKFFPLFAVVIGFASQGAFGQVKCLPFSKVANKTLCTHTVQTHENLSSILFKIGEKLPAPMCLYGRDGWVIANQTFNGSIKDWTRLAPGTKLALRIPLLKGSDACAPLKSTKVEMPAETSKKIPKETLTETSKQIPKKTLTETSKKIPKKTVTETSKKIPKKVLKKKRRKKSLSKKKRNANVALKSKPAAERSSDDGASYNIFSKGHVGLRYGYPVTKGDELISKSSFLGIFAEVRAGPLDGLRWYWDYSPETKAEVNNETMSLAWSRASLGWSFGLDVDTTFLHRIDLTPKLGLMDLDAKVPFPTRRGIVPVKFRFRNAKNLGLELGMETASPWFLLRFWGATDVSGVLDLGGPGSIASLRGGVDTYWDVDHIFDDLRLSILVFGFGEKLTLKKKDSDVDAETNVRVDRIGYTLGIVGAGLILYW